MAWFDFFLWPRAALSDLQRDVSALRLVDIPALKTFLEATMAADRDLLNELAADLTTLATPVSDLIAAHEAAVKEIAELKGEAAADEAGDVAAIAPVREAFNRIADKFKAEPEVPDVEPLPEPEAPVEETPAEPAEEPVGEDDTAPPAA